MKKMKKAILSLLCMMMLFCVAITAHAAEEINAEAENNASTWSISGISIDHRSPCIHGFWRRPCAGCCCCYRDFWWRRSYWASFLHQEYGRQDFSDLSRWFLAPDRQLSDKYPWWKWKFFRLLSQQRRGSHHTFCWLLTVMHTLALWPEKTVTIA